MEELIKREYIYRGRIMNLRLDTVRVKNGDVTLREIAEHHGAVAMVPLDEQGNVTLVKQWRAATGRVMLEIPAGTLEENEAPESGAPRELREETGYTARRIRHLLDYWPTSAFSDELLRLYVADGLTPGRESPDHDEFIEAVAVPYKEALDLVWKGRIKDSKTVIALLAVNRL